MSQEQKQQIISLAKGHWQRWIVRNLLSGDPVVNPVSTLTGRAKDYQMQYRQSFLNLLSRLQAAGYRIEKTPGVRGGEWSATYRLIVN